MSMVRSVPFALVASALAAAPIRVPVPEPSEELGTMPPAEYVTDYHPLPIDALPARAIQEYNPSVRVPEYHWMECEGANALALRIRPITLEELRKEVSVGLIDTNRNKTALLFTKEAEADAGNRRVEIRNLDLPSGEFTGLKYSCVTPNAADLRSGVRTKGDRIDAVWFEVPENSGVFEIIDLRLERKAAKARFTDLPARRWTRKDGIRHS